MLYIDYILYIYIYRYTSSLSQHAARPRAHTRANGMGDGVGAEVMNDAHDSVFVRTTLHPGPWSLEQQIQRAPAHATRCCAMPGPRRRGRGRGRRRVRCSWGERQRCELLRVARRCSWRAELCRSRLQLLNWCEWAVQPRISNGGRLFMAAQSRRRAADAVGGTSSARTRDLTLCGQERDEDGR